MHIRKDNRLDEIVGGIRRIVSAFSFGMDIALPAHRYCCTWLSEGKWNNNLNNFQSITDKYPDKDRRI